MLHYTSPGRRRCACSKAERTRVPIESGAVLVAYQSAILKEACVAQAMRVILSSPSLSLALRKRNY